MNFAKLKVGDLFEWQGQNYRVIDDVVYQDETNRQCRFNAVYACPPGQLYCARYFQPSTPVRKL